MAGGPEGVDHEQGAHQAHRQVHPCPRHGTILAHGGKMAHARMAGGRRASGGHEPTNEGETTMEQLTGLDATFLYLETPSLHMHVSMAAIFDPSTVPGGYSFDKLRDLVSSRLELAPIFRRRLVEVPFRLGHPYWVDDPTFDIEYHIRRGAVPAPGGVEELAQFVGDVCSRQLDRTKPLWEMYIVEGLRGGQIAVVTKIHHCTIDGVSGAELLSQLFDLEPDPPARPAPDTPLAVDEHLPSDLQLVAQSLGTRMTRPLGMTKLAWRTGRALLDVRRVRARGSEPRRVAAHHAAHVAQRVHHPAPARGVLLDLARRRQAHQAGVRHHAQRRGPGRMHRRAAPVPPRRRRAARRAARGHGAGVDRPDRRQPTRRQQGLGHVRGPSLSDRGSRRDDCTPSGTARRGPRRSTTPWAPTCCSIGPSTPPRTCSRPRPAPTRASSSPITTDRSTAS